MAYSSILIIKKSTITAGKTVITSDHALKLESVPDWIAIVGSGYIGLEFSDVYTALGSEVIHLCDTYPFFFHYILFMRNICK